jgi:hypothetical protein
MEEQCEQGVSKSREIKDSYLRHPSNTSIYPALPSVEVCHKPMIQEGIQHSKLHDQSRYSSYPVSVAATYDSTVLDIFRDEARYAPLSTMGINRCDRLHPTHPEKLPSVDHSGMRLSDKICHSWRRSFSFAAAACLLLDLSLSASLSDI